MKILSSVHRRMGVAALIVMLFLLLPHVAFAHAVLVRSTPANASTVQSGDVDVKLTYNSRIDAARSSVSLIGTDGKPRKLSLDQHAAPNVLAAKATALTAGAYRLQWQVLASDGHITRGVVTFHVS